MRVVLLIRSKDSALGAFKDLIPESYSVLESEMDARGLQLLRSIISGIVVVDIATRGVLPWMEDAYRWRPDLTYLGVTGDPSMIHFLSKYFYDFLYPPFTSDQLTGLLERSWERAEMRYELQSLKKTGPPPPERALAVQSGSCNGNGNRLRERVLCDFSRVLNNNFDQVRLFDLFLDSVVELVPVGKISILLMRERMGHYAVSMQRGLEPKFCAELRFRPSRGLISWLKAEARLFLIEGLSCAGGFTDTEAIQEMHLLQAVVSIPLTVHGELVGALNLGPKITGAPFYEEELETLYILAGNVALALRDIQLHHQLRFQNLYIESILQRMTSGVVAINSEDKITTFNHRAGEILSLTADEMINKDLRLLPSPLGDILFDSMSTGSSYYAKEIELARNRLPLEISSYQLASDGRVLGSVMVFDDISERRRFEQKRRQADKLDVLNKFVGQLAHEVKNPLVAIQTFTELLPEKYEDSSFRDFFTHTVRQEVKRLNELVEQLIAFSAPLSYRFEVVEIKEVLDMAVLLLQEQGKGAETTINTAYTEERVHIRADQTALSRGLSYLVNSFESVEQGGDVNIQTLFDQALFDSGGVSIGIWDLKTKPEAEELQRVFDPLSAKHSSYISLELPVARKIIEDHGGRVTARLLKDKYLKFEVQLPMFATEGGEGVD
ncbi:MAG: GAF domain-containing protein [Firmicutes bacterium]|nr:GAF domain-containing protein [Bacillota bacterium]MBV1726714.1 GAF domain-containing protein [Desulforudis sp.]MBV1734691.1 GAF domain-containing protein [Desulforudis sp.]